MMANFLLMAWLLLLGGWLIGFSDSLTVPNLKSNLKSTNQDNEKSLSVIESFADAPSLSTTTNSFTDGVTANFKNIARLADSENIATTTQESQITNSIPEAAVLLTTTKSSSFTSISPTALPAGVNNDDVTTLGRSIRVTEVGSIEPISNEPETEQETTDERPPANASLLDRFLPEPMATEIPETQTIDTLHTESLFNDIHIERKLQNGLYRIKLAEIVTDEFSGATTAGTTDSSTPVTQSLEDDGLGNQLKRDHQTMSKINIVDLYPTKKEDFNPIIQGSNEKLLKEKTIFTSEDLIDSASVGANVDYHQNLLPNEVQVDSDAFQQHRSLTGKSINRDNAKKNEPVKMIDPHTNPITDFTGKLLEEQDGVITEIEEKFQLDEMGTVFTTTTTRQPKLSRATEPAAVLVNHKINHEFIDRRVKKSFDFPMHRSASLHQSHHIDFANTKFNMDVATASDFGASMSKLQGTSIASQSSTNAGGIATMADMHPEFSTTKFYNSKELYNVMLQRKKNMNKTHTLTPEHSDRTLLTTVIAQTSNGDAASDLATATIDNGTQLKTTNVDTKGNDEQRRTLNATTSIPTTPTQTASLSPSSLTTTTHRDPVVIAKPNTQTRAKPIGRAKLQLQEDVLSVGVKSSTTSDGKAILATTTSSNEKNSSKTMESSPQPIIVEVHPTTLAAMTSTEDNGKPITPSSQTLLSATDSSSADITTNSTSYNSMSDVVINAPQLSSFNNSPMTTTKPTKSPSLSKPIARPRILSRLQEKINSLECDIQNVPLDSQLWHGNETHELLLPIVTPENCESQPYCTPAKISWESQYEIQSGDILIVEINDTLLNPSQPSTYSARSTQVYQVTRSGHEHCDVTEGVLLDIAALVVDDKKLVTLYDRDLTEGTNLLIVVSEFWGAQCVRLKVTMKSDNCGESADCSGKGVCFSNESMEGYECQCCSGFAGPHCEEIDACSPSPCTNNGICVDLSQGHEGNAYQCLCPYGYTGKNCQYESDPCNPAECMNGGSCVGNSSHFRCDCTPGYTGPLCQHNLNECESSPCVHGICVDQEDGFRCFCQPGFSGELCNFEYNECESNPCLNDGECIDQIGGFECRCSKGYTGNRCHIKVDFCSNKPCPEGHRCIDHGNDFSCECPGGRNGPDCNRIPRTQCNVNPCTHGGTCWSSGDSFYCACRPGYTGTMCEDEFVVETVVSSSEFMVDDTSARNFNEKALGSVVMKSPIELHNAYIAAGVLAAAIFIVAIVVTICHCKVNQTYRKFSTRSPAFFPILGFGRRNKTQKLNKHWLSGKGFACGNRSGNPLRSSSSRNYLPGSGASQYTTTTTTANPALQQQQPQQQQQSGNCQLQNRPFQRHLAMNLENDMYYTVDFSEQSQHSPLIQ